MARTTTNICLWVSRCDRLRHTVTPPPSPLSLPRLLTGILDLPVSTLEYEGQLSEEKYRLLSAAPD